MKVQLPLAALALSVGLASVGGAFAQNPPPKEIEVSIDKLALTNIPVTGAGKLTVTSPAFKNMEDIPFENTQYRTNTFPGLSWSKGPASTKSYAIIMQDTDVKLPTGMPILHWTMYNIPATTTALPAGMAAAGDGAFGPNARGPSSPYLGPKPPAGPKHRYHLQVFALDTTIAAAPTTYDALAAAMTGHVVASGQIIGLGQFDPSYVPPPPAAPAAPAPAAPN